MDKVELYLYAKEGLERHAADCGISASSYYQPVQKENGLGRNDYFELFCGLLSDRQYMGNIVKFYVKGEAVSDTQKFLLEVLSAYNPEEVLNNYGSAEALFEEIKTRRPDKVQNEEKWAEYITGIYMCAEYLTKGKLADIEMPFERVLQEPTSSDDMKVYLHDLRLFTDNMSGVGIAVCYNWLKECGAFWLAKPDMHIKRVVAELLRSEMQPEDYVVIDAESDKNKRADKLISTYLKKYKAKKSFPKGRGISGRKSLRPDEFVAFYMYEWSEEIRKSGKDDAVTPFKLDRILYLYCTEGNFFNDADKCRKNPIITEENLLDKI